MNNDLSDIFFKFFVAGLVILMAPLLIWIAAVDRFGNGVTDNKITSILVFIAVIQGIFWKMTESFFAAWIINLIISVIAVCFSLMFGHN
jgi:hypothetical protein